MLPYSKSFPLVQVVIQCRADRRLACLRKQAGGRKSALSASKGSYHPLISSLRPNLIRLVGKARLIEFNSWRGEIEMNLPPDSEEVLAAGEWQLFAVHLIIHL